MSCLWIFRSALSSLSQHCHLIAVEMPHGLSILFKSRHKFILRHIMIKRCPPNAPEGIFIPQSLCLHSLCLWAVIGVIAQAKFMWLGVFVMTGASLLLKVKATSLCKILYCGRVIACPKNGVQAVVSRELWVVSCTPARLTLGLKDGLWSVDYKSDSKPL